MNWRNCDSFSLLQNYSNFLSAALYSLVQNGFLKTPFLEVSLVMIFMLWRKISFLDFREFDFCSYIYIERIVHEAANTWLHLSELIDFSLAHVRRILLLVLLLVFQMSH